MAEHDLEKLVGGFAADQLTPEERKLLFTAALRDQQLFNALADEQALKELLADPVVRRRLLQSLHDTRASGVGGSRSWLAWFKRPAGLAWAYGLAAAVLAIVLGTRIYQDSLKQAVQVATEETTTPASPSAARSPHLSPPQQGEPQAKANGDAAPAAAAKQNELFDKTTRPEPSAPSKPQASPSSAAPRDTRKSSEQDALLQQGQGHVPGSGQAPDERANSAGQTSPTNNSFPRSATLEREARQGIANAPAAMGSIEPSLRARALFYADALEPAAEPERRPSAASDTTSAEPRMAEAPRKEKKRAERYGGLIGKLEHAAPAEKPLGVRYSLIMAGPGGIDMEVDPATPIGKENLPRLAIQTTESGYLYVLEEQEASGKPTSIFPASGEGRITGRTTIPVALSSLFREEPASRRIRLLLVFSRKPLDAVSGIPYAKHASPLLIEQVNPGQPGAATEQAVYVMSQDPSLALLSVEIPVSVH